MAPPRTSTTPLLSELVPLEVATAALEAVVSHIGKLGFRLTPTVTLVVPGTPAYLAELTDFGLTTQVLTEYAQRGAPVGDWVDDTDAADAWMTVYGALYDRAYKAPGDDEVDVIASMRDVMPEDAITVMMLAARARIALSQGAPVRSCELAVLSGLGQRHVQKAFALGARKRSSSLTAAKAKAWLAEHGVAGFVQKAG